jgi:hypothetical protein
MKFFLAVLMLVVSHTVVNGQACCCTGAGANYSILPNLNRHVLGMRYTYRSYQSVTNSLNPELDGNITNQQFHSLELFGRFNVYERLQLSVFLPYNFIAQQSPLGNSRADGLGDISFLLQYNILNPLLCTGRKDKHQLRLGAGVKLPSGHFKMDANDMFNTNLQLGTGSVDLPFNVIYTFRYEGFGFNTVVAYKFNTTNPQAYRFGDKLQGALNLFYVKDIKEVQLMPSIGFNYEHQFENRYKGKLLSYTGGDFATFAIGFDVYYKTLAFSSSFSPAVMNRLNWNGENRNRLNFEAGVFYNFSTKTKP